VKEVQTIKVTIAYTPGYLDWKLGAGHPTNPERARLAVEKLTTWAATNGVELATRVPGLEWTRIEREAGLVHDTAYVDEVRSGRCAEWPDTQERLGEVAALMFTGTVDLIEQMLIDDQPGIYFNPQGAKHHAHRDHGSGFCVLNDMAWAATRLAKLGKRVLYIDWDAHHGDGVEALLLNTPKAVTASIHDGTIFPGTGRDGSDPARGAYNWALPAGCGDTGLDTAICDVIRLADELQPDVVLLACGADGLADDPLSTLNYSLPGIEHAAAAVGSWCGRHRVPIVVGGAGGYQPLTQTPEAWARTIISLHTAMTQGLASGPTFSHADHQRRNQ
jgi:acetoin utilization protein AcuC